MRRALALSAVVVAGLVVAGCSSVDSDDIAASVNGVELSQEKFEEFLVPPADEGDDAPATPVDGDIARSRLSSWTILEILREEVAATGAEVTQQNLDDAAAQLEAGDASWSTYPPALQEMLVELQATAAVWTGGHSPTDVDDVQAAYEQGIDPSGVACVAHILVETEAEAQAILDELEGGGDFATVAAEHTTDTASAASGGALPCATSGQFQQTYVEPFVDAALGAEVGVPTGPVSTQFGYHVLQLRPFDDVSDDVVNLYDSVPLRFRRLATEADVTVDPRYGTFDPNAGVVPLG